MKWDLSRWLWLVTLVALVPAVVWAPALWLALGVTVANILVFRIRTGSWAAFPVQVRVFYLLVMLPALWPPLQLLLAAQALGTFLAVFVDYCTSARIVSLMPWNRATPLTLSEAWQTFTRPPVRNVMATPSAVHTTRG